MALASDLAAAVASPGPTSFQREASSRRARAAGGSQQMAGGRWHQMATGTAADELWLRRAISARPPGPAGGPRQVSGPKLQRLRNDMHYAYFPAAAGWR